MTRGEKGDNVEDGADEKMLATDDKEQLARKDEVKFIASDRSNGDAKIDIGSIEKVCNGGQINFFVAAIANSSKREKDKTSVHYHAGC